MNIAGLINKYKSVIQAKCNISPISFMTQYESYLIFEPSGKLLIYI